MIRQNLKKSARRTIEAVFSCHLSRIFGGPSMQWNWDAISAISSVVGGVGVIISVVFLVYEVRRNAQAIEGATVQALMSLEREVFAMLASHAELFTRGRRNRSDLSEEDQFRFDMVVKSEMSLVYSAFVQFEQNLIDQEVWDAYLSAARAHIEHPGFAESWESFKFGYPKSFRDMMDTSAKSLS